MKSEWFNGVRESDAAVAEQSPEDRTEDGPIWQEFIDPKTLRPYYINKESGNTKWTHPLWEYETFYLGVQIGEKIVYLPEYFNNNQRVADPKLYGWTIQYLFSDGIYNPIYFNPKNGSYYDVKKPNPLVGYITLYNTNNGTKYYYDEGNQTMYILDNDTNLNAMPLKTSYSLKDTTHSTQYPATGGRKKTRSKRSKRRRKTKRLRK
jgi:hypothetical protein